MPETPKAKDNSVVIVRLTRSEALAFIAELDRVIETDVAVGDDATQLVKLQAYVYGAL